MWLFVYMYTLTYIKIIQYREGKLHCIASDTITTMLYTAIVLSVRADIHVLYTQNVHFLFMTSKTD